VPSGLVGYGPLPSGLGLGTVAAALVDDGVDDVAVVDDGVDDVEGDVGAEGDVGGETRTVDDVVGRETATGPAAGAVVVARVGGGAVVADRAPVAVAEPVDTAAPGRVEGGTLSWRSNWTGAGLPVCSSPGRVRNQTADPTTAAPTRQAISTLGHRLASLS
jgi:hypothetical protein